MKESPQNQTAEAPETQSTEERILEAAVREFMLKGFAGARTTAIAEAAGVTHAMLHYYFRTKEKLFNKIIESKIATLRDVMLSSLGDPSIPLFDKIKSAVENHLDFIAANPDLPRFMINEVICNPDKMSLVTDQLMHHTPLVVGALQRQIDEYAAKGLCRRVNAGMLMLDITSLNIFPFTAAPMVDALLGNILGKKEKFLEKRKKENVETIMRKLRP